MSHQSPPGWLLAVAVAVLATGALAPIVRSVSGWSLPLSLASAAGLAGLLLAAYLAWDRRGDGS